MKTFPQRLLRFATVLASLTAGISSLAFTFVLNNNTGLPVKWPPGQIPIKIMLGDTKTLLDGSNFNASARTAAETWNSVIGSTQFTSTVTTGTPGSGNKVNELGFSDKIFGKDFDADTLAVTTGYSIGNERSEADIIFNTAYNWDSYRGNTRSSGGALLVDLQRVAVHELGHVLGMDHPDQATPTQSVSAIMNSRVGNLYELSTDDINGVQSLYGPPGVPANDNFANSTVITLTSGNSTSLKGFNTNATRETGEPTQGGNPGGHSVWWHWVAPSSGSVILDTGKVDATTKKIDLTGGKSSTFDSTLGVYTGSTLATLTKVAESDDIDPGVVQISSLTFSATAGTTYRFAVDGFNNEDGNGADSGAYALNLNFNSVGGTLPSITSQPSSLTVNSGNSVSFSVTATGSEPLAYQWQFNSTNIAGATSASYSISSASTAQAGNYSVVVSNAAGSVTSNTASLTVNVPTPTPTPTPSGGGGGGGGAPSVWFCLVLVLLGLGRFLQRMGN